MQPRKPSDYHQDNDSITAYVRSYYSESAIIKIKREDVQADFQRP